MLLSAPSSNLTLPPRPYMSAPHSQLFVTVLCHCHCRRASRHGPGWFFGHPSPSIRVALCAAVTFVCGVCLLSAGMAAAYSSISMGALSHISEQPFVYPTVRVRIRTALAACAQALTAPTFCCYAKFQVLTASTLIVSRDRQSVSIPRWRVCSVRHHEYRGPDRLYNLLGRRKRS